ncbi:DUF2628 domain-containing protein [Uliginosibacterium aquaticum]|uniref:DUF2628 domain-containing protein n=1 Tax=Uliginosibacterium aquaticum TaxID=2731212 RepID=A0ABX2IL52_9RHOO|nr:DUF2628 domain-containing protein [Uliginosibacterium aquaticum]NSL55752.1 DUF2628 domain-containing protein [Uliginosibacterium aquaticum]
MNQPLNPYQPPTAELLHVPITEQLDLQEQRLANFVGAKYPFYRDKWAAAALKRQPTSWNWAAFVLGLSWLAYRKMYAYCAIFIAIIGLETLLELVIGLPDSLSYAMNIGTSVMFGLYGNTLYRHFAQGRIAAIETAGGRPEQIDAEITRAGGTHLGAAFGFMLLLCVLLVGLALMFPGG